VKVDPVAERRTAVRHAAGQQSRRIAVLAGVAALLLVVGAIVVPLGRRRGWRAD
jgi:hypothetical protein